AGCLVFWMNAGFACVEAGFCRSKNIVHVLAMNYLIIAVTTVSFWAIGFGIMFGDGNAFMGLSGFFPSLLDKTSFTVLGSSGVAISALFFFQMVFADTAGTILSGVIAERMKLSAYILFAFIMGAVLYPTTGHWIWGGGWLGQMGFHDFAGSTVVHSIGGWVGLTGALLVGARLGKYNAQGKPRAIKAHNMSLVAIGGFILWLGWFGFNPGSTLAADPKAIGHIFLTTNFAGAAGTFTAIFAAWLKTRKVDFGVAINGTLAGLVAITAPCDGVSMIGALAIGAAAGVFSYYATFFFDYLRIDDPVGALSVHLVNGIWGTLAFGLFATKAGSVGTVDGLLYGGGSAQLMTQLIGVAAVGGFMVVASTLAWLLVKAVVGLRVTAAAELGGLDLHDHDMSGYELDEPIVDTDAGSIDVPSIFQPAYARCEKFAEETAEAQR
ncbi:ammonium transporter, partial [Candidatus Peregrinibacteria bacterium]|nr:ammonium transporter [Candidatus Peregrinibacteria bacterium]